MSQLPYARSKDASNTYYLTFKAVHQSRDGLNSGSIVDADTGKSPVSRWLTGAFAYDDFTSNPDSVGHEVRFLLPPNTFVLRVAARVDTAFVGTGNNDIDIGDDDDPDGWGDALDFSSTGGKYDPNSEFNPAGTTGFKYYSDLDSIDVQFKNATAPTAGEALLHVEVISYHEDLGAEF